MKSWQPIALQLARQNTTLGSTINITGVTQDSITSEFIIMCEGVIGTSAATAAIEGLSSIVQKVNISGPLQGYAPLTPINGLTGPMLSEVAQFIRHNVSYSWGALGSTGKFGVAIPCTFVNPRMPWPLSHSCCLPTKDMGSVNFNVQIASQAQLDTNATPTIAFTSLSVYVQQNEYKPGTTFPRAQLGTAPTNTSLWYFVPSSWNYFQNLNIQASAGNQQLFPNNAMLLLLVRSFSTTSNGVATARQSDTVAGGPIDISITSPGLILQDVAQAPKLAVTWNSLRGQNLNQIFDSLVTGNACFQMNQGANAVFQPQVGPNQLPLIYPTVTTGTTTPRLDFVYQNIIDPSNWWGLQ